MVPQRKINWHLASDFLQKKVCLAPGVAASLKRSGGIQRRTGTGSNSCTGIALQKKMRSKTNK
jgi:hypothetical protein